MNSQFEQNLNNRFEQKCQFQQKYQQSIWTNLTTIKWKKKQKLTINMDNDRSKQFEQKCQYLIWIELIKMNLNRCINQQLERKYQQSILKKNINNQIEQTYQPSILNRNINNQLEQTYQPSISNKNKNIHFTKIIADEFKKTNIIIKLDFQQSYWSEISTINFEQKYHQSIWTNLSTINFEQK